MRTPSPPVYNLLILNNKKVEIFCNPADKWAGLARAMFSARPCALNAAGMALVWPVLGSTFKARLVGGS